MVKKIRNIDTNLLIISGLLFAFLYWIVLEKLKKEKNSQQNKNLKKESFKEGRFDLTCPHAGCKVEKKGNEYVCPCHGSRFSVSDGSLLEGPATKGLTPL